LTVKPETNKGRIRKGGGVKCEYFSVQCFPVSNTVLHFESFQDLLACLSDMRSIKTMIKGTALLENKGLKEYLSQCHFVLRKSDSLVPDQAWASVVRGKQPTT